MSQVIINDIPPYTQAQVPMGGQSVFGTNWTANVESDVVVYLTPVGDLPDDATQKLQYPSDFSVAFVGALQEVQVTLVTPANEGDIVTITRQTPADRENLYSNTNFLPSMLNNDFGILTLVDQQAQLVNQMIAPRYNYSAIINPAPFLTRDTILPLLGPNETWVMNASHTAIEAAAFSTGAGTITEIDTGLGLTGGPITSSGSISFGPMTANTFWGNITSGTGLPTMVTTGYFLQSAKNLSDLTNVTQAQTNLDLLIGVNVQAYSAILTSLAALPGTAKTIPYFATAGNFGSLGPAANSVLVTNASSVPSLSTFLPLTVQSNITQLGVQTLDFDMGNHQIHNLLDPSAPQDAATKAYVTAQTVGTYLPLGGGTMTGAINMGNQQINHMADPTAPQDAVTSAFLSATLNGYLLKSGGTMTGNINMGSFAITNLLDPVNPQDAATKNYVDTVATGLTVQPAVYAATTANLNALYVNGASGIGATLTNNGALAQFTTDGTTPPTNARILVKDQTTTFQNGIYVLTNQGSGSVAWILTRSTDYDQPAEIQPGDLVIVNNGTTYAGTSFVETASVSVIGTDPILFSQFTFSATAVLLKANNLSDVANTVTSFNNISPSTTKGDLIVNDGTNDVRLPVGGSDGQILQVKAAAATGLAYSTATYPVTTTANQILYSSATNTITGISTTVGGVLVTDASSVPQFLANPGATGRILQSVNGAIAAWSTPTYPSTSATSRKIIVSDGTNFVPSTETYAVPGASGNVLTSDGTNWTSAPPVGTGTVNAGTGGQLAYYATTGTAVSGLSLGQGLSIASTTLHVGESNNLQFNTGKGFQDSNTNPLLLFTVTGSAVNYLNITNSSTGTNPTLSSAGTDSNVGMIIQTKGTGSVVFQAGTLGILTLSAATSAVNFFTMTSEATGTGPTIVSTGSDSNVQMNFSAKGTAGFTFNSDALGSSKTILTLTPTASAVNWITINSVNTANPPSIVATGTDTNISLQINSKGTGGVQIKGVSDGSTASAGYVGEIISSQIDIGSAVSFSNATAKSLTSITLTPGDWDVWGCFNQNPAVTTTTSNLVVAISTVNNTLPTQSINTPLVAINASTTASAGHAIMCGPGIQNVTVNTTIYLVAKINFAVSTMTGFGWIIARRRR